MSGKSTCTTCNGTGKVVCHTCDGRGDKYLVQTLGFWESDCDVCYGLGSVCCPDCRGRGRILQVVPGPVMARAYKTGHAAPIS